MTHAPGTLVSAALLAAMSCVAPALAVPVMTESQVIPDPTGDTSEGFGVRTTILGDALFVEANTDDPFQYTGRLYFFTRTGGVWSYHAEVTYPDDPANIFDTHAYDDFASSLSFDGSTLVAAAPGDGWYGEGFDPPTGAIHIFTPFAGLWVHTQEIQFPDAPHELVTGLGGNATLVDADTIFALSLPNGYVSDYQQAIEVFTYDGSTWVYDHRIELPVQAMFTSELLYYTFGAETIYVGHPYNDDLAQDAGTVYVYENTPTGWTLADQLDPNGTTIYGRFGSKVVDLGDTLLVSAPGDRTLANGGGAVYVFSRGTSGWEFQQKIFPDDPEVNQDFGSPLVAGDGFVVAGSRYTTVDGVTNAGALFVLRPLHGSWQITHELTASQPFTNAFLSYGLSVSDDAIIACAPNGYDGSGLGAAYIFDIPPAPCAADLDGNAVLNLDDINLFATAFTSNDLAADIDGNAVLNLDDINLFAAAFTAGCPQPPRTN